MNFAIVGSGAVGGYYGARLARAGHRVTFVARGAHLEAIRARWAGRPEPARRFHRARAGDRQPRGARAGGRGDARREGIRQPHRVADAAADGGPGERRADAPERRGQRG